MSLYNIIGLIFICGIVWDIKLMSSPKTAVKGNFLGSLCMIGAIILTMVSKGVVSCPILWTIMIMGGLIGYFLAVKVTMIQMPQLVGLLNGLGGGASAIVSLVVLLNNYEALTFFSKFTADLALVVGGITLSGSLIAAAKLARRMKQQPIVLKKHTLLNILILGVLVFFIVLTVIASPETITIISLLTLIIAICFGIIFTIRVGGADMPVTISLLNSMSGLAGAITGFAIYNPLLVAIGAIVGAAGLILTKIMCRAMNRSLWTVLTGKTTLSTVKVLNEDNKNEDTQNKVLEKQISKKETIEGDDPTAILNKAKKVVIVPGYGMAIAQAQAQVKKLLEKLEEKGKEVKFAIHPVAGRMPGHMNVLLAEVDIDYDKLFELDKINPEFKETDLVIIIGANDVVNSAANTAQGTPIYGMPILRVDEAKDIFILNLDTKPGYAGVENPLYTTPKVKLFLGDAVETVKELIEKLDE